MAFLAAGFDLPWAAMDWISSLEKRFGSWAIPHLGLYIILLQGIGFFLLAGESASVSDLVLYGDGVIHAKEWWRLFSFMMMPADMNPFFLLLAIYIFYMMSSALEQRWGSFRFNLFILLGYLFTVTAAFIKPDVVIVNTYFLGAVFLAFATLFPDVEFNLFFILPVKVKWLGWITAAGFAMSLFGGAAGHRLCALAAFLVYALFFGRDYLRGQVATKRRKAFVAENAKVESTARHICTVCGVTDQSDPTLDFRYCSICGNCFCEEHIQQHQHEK